MFCSVALLTFRIIIIKKKGACDGSGVIVPRKAANKSPIPNVRHNREAKRKDKADSASRERSRGSKEERDWGKVDWHQYKMSPE